MHSHRLLGARSGARGRFKALSALFLAALLVPFASLCAHAASEPAAPAAPATLKVDGLGKGTAPLEGPWQFHLGDNSAWAQPTIDDTTGHDGWEELTADAPWGTQGHANYTGYGWYRRHIDITPAPGAPSDIALLIPAIDDVYEVYWNGQSVGRYGSFPPHLDWYSMVPPHTWGLGPARSGVLAIRVFKVPLSSNDDGKAGGFEATPSIGSAAAISALKASRGYDKLRGMFFRDGLTLLYLVVSLVSFFTWLRDRRQSLLLWMTIYTLMPLLELILNASGVQASYIWLTFLVQISIQVREVSQWFLLLWLLQLHEVPWLVRALRITAFVAILIGAADGALGFAVNWISIPAFQISDAVLTFFILPPEIIPVALAIYAVVRRKKLAFERWLVASLALLSGTFYSISNIAAQGVRFTHWTLADRMNEMHVSIFGTPFAMQTILRTLLILAIIYAVARYAIAERRSRAAMELEFQNAREIQQVLVPETLPPIPGFTLTSAYKPALEVGGDFFQIVSLEDQSTLIVLGDVSGKGLRAAMAVSLIVGAIRSVADATASPAAILTHLNRHLFGRLQGGFATCIALHLGRDGACTLASAGHPAPLLNDRELDLAGAIPLGLIPTADYNEASIQLRQGDRLALYTDGLLEARAPGGELYGFERLYTLFATNPSAAKATEAAVAFGQEDDITVLTLQRATPA